LRLGWYMSFLRQGLCTLYNPIHVVHD